VEQTSLGNQKRVKHIHNTENVSTTNVFVYTMLVN